MGRPRGVAQKPVPGNFDSVGLYFLFPARMPRHIVESDVPHSFPPEGTGAASESFTSETRFRPGRGLEDVTRLTPAPDVTAYESE